MEDCRKPANARARIVTQADGSLTATRTQGRDSGFNVAIVSKPGMPTKMAMVSADGSSTLELGGHSARTLYRVLHRHYAQTGKPLGFRTPSGEGGCECCR